MRASPDLGLPTRFDEAAAHERLARPHVGMPVRYHRAGRTDAGIVTLVHSDTVVNLRVFGDDNEVPTHAAYVERAGGERDTWWEPA